MKPYPRSSSTKSKAPHTLNISFCFDVLYLLQQGLFRLAWILYISDSKDEIQEKEYLQAMSPYSTNTALISR